MGAGWRLREAWRHTGLWPRLAIMVGLGLLGLFALFATLSLRALDASTQRILAERLVIAQMAARSEDALLRQALFELEKATTFADFDPADPDLAEEMHMLAHSYGRISTLSLGVLFLDAAGRVVLAEPWDAAPYGQELSDLPHIARSMLERRSTFSQPYQDVRTGQPAVAVTLPLTREDGSLKALLVGAIDLSSPAVVGPLEHARRLGHTGHAELVDARGMILASTEGGMASQPGEHLDFYRRMAGGREAVETVPYSYAEVAEADAPRHIMAYTPLQSVDWGVAVGGDAVETLAPVRRLEVTLFVVGAVGLVAALGITLLGARQLIGPILALTGAAQRIASGDVSTPIQVPAVAELGTLAGSLEAMRVALGRSIEDLEERVAERTSELERRNRELRVAGEIAVLASQSLDLETVLESALERVMAVTGAHAGSVYVRDGDGALTLRLSRGVTRRWTREEARIHPGQCLCGLACLDGETLLCGDLAEDSRVTRPACRQVGFRSAAAVPLFAREETVGLINLLARDREHFSPADVPLLDAIGHQVGIAVENARLVAELREREQVRRRLLQRVIGAQEEERMRLSRELHDETLQALAAVSVALGTAQKALGTAPLGVGRQLEQVSQLLRGTLGELRRMIFDLRPSALDDLGLVPALQRYARERLAPQGVEVTFDTPDLPDRLPPPVEGSLFRIIQEALTNVAKHARASRVTVGLYPDGGRVRAVVRDDGIGFDPGLNPSTQGEGLGLVSMRERAELMGGQLQTLSAAGLGTEVRIEMPLRPGEEGP